MKKIPEQTKIQPDLATPYPLGDYPPACGGRDGVGAVRTGEHRPPRKGEWYLSGAMIAAYQAKNDLATPYHIARLVRVETGESFNNS